MPCFYVDQPEWAEFVDSIARQTVLDMEEGTSLDQLLERFWYRAGSAYDVLPPDPAPLEKYAFMGSAHASFQLDKTDLVDDRDQADTDATRALIAYQQQFDP